MSATRFGIGQAVRRVEDQRFLTGQGRYLDDINLEGQLHARVLRSPHAHAEIRGIDVTEATALPGVAAVLTGTDVAADGLGDIPAGAVVTSRDGQPNIVPPRPARPWARAGRASSASPSPWWSPRPQPSRRTRPS